MMNSSQKSCYLSTKITLVKSIPLSLFSLKKNTAKHDIYTWWGFAWNDAKDAT